MRRYSIFDSGSQGKRYLTATIVNTFLAKIVKLHFPSTAKISLKTCLQKSNIGYSQRNRYLSLNSALKKPPLVLRWLYRDRFLSPLYFKEVFQVHFLSFSGREYVNNDFSCVH